MDEEASPSPASFEGRLKLQDFMFQANAPSNMTSPTTYNPRRSNRLLPPSGPALSSTSPSRSRSRSSLTPVSARSTKRKPTSGPDENEDNNTTPPTPSPSKRPRSRPKSGYAPPSTYAHLPPLRDVLAPNLLVLFVGLNPGIQTALQGHAYAHPSNLFWKLLFSSGIATRLLSPTEDRNLPTLLGCGNTNIVARPSRNGAELSKAEMDAGVAVLEEKVRRWRPEVVCVVGKSIWESVWRVRHGRGIRKEEFKYGWQEERENMGVVGEEGQREEEREDGVDYGDGGAWLGAKVFVASSTSGLAATLRPAEKEAIWRELGVWVERRREERKLADEAGSSA